MCGFPGCFDFWWGWYNIGLWGLTSGGWFGYVIWRVLGVSGGCLIVLVWFGWFAVWLLVVGIAWVLVFLGCFEVGVFAGGLG